MTRHLSLARRILRRSRDSEGNTLIETAIVLPLLLLVTLAVVDFGALFYVDLALENGVSQAARYGVTGNVMTGLTREQSIMTTMRQATPTLTIADSAFAFSYLAPGSSVWASGPAPPGDIEMVTVNYTWKIITPLIQPFFKNGQINFTVQSSMQTESLFQQ
jgi:Flp pilus assembly protein TadG